MKHGNSAAHVSTQTLPLKQQQQQPQGDIMVMLAQELYRVVLFAAFFAQVWLVSFIPLLGELSTETNLKFRTAAGILQLPHISAAKCGVCGYTHDWHDKVAV